MGAKDKHKRGQSRNNMNFKVVGGKAGKAKGRPQPVDIKLKKLAQGRNKKTDEVAKLDKQFKEMQQKAVSMQKKPVMRTKIEPAANSTTLQEDVNVDAMMDDFSKFGQDSEKTQK